MTQETPKKRIAVFVDGQNLYMSCKDAFGYNFPNYDLNKLSDKIAEKNPGTYISSINFYTGIPEKNENPFWHGFWTKKLAIMGTRGIKTFWRPIRYQEEVIELENGKKMTIRVGHEKGVDVRLALDVVRLAIENAYDIAVIFSQDQDLSEVVDEVALISKKYKRVIQVVSAYPISTSSQNKRGINGAIQNPINQAFYDQCIDPLDYRPPAPTFNPAIPL